MTAIRGFWERFWVERGPGRRTLVFGGPSWTYKLIVVREERNNL